MKAPLDEDSSPEPLVNLFLAKFSDFVNTTVAWVGNIWFSSTLHWYFSLKMKQYPYELGKWGFCSDWILGLVPSFLYETTHKFLTKGERHKIFMSLSGSYCLRSSELKFLHNRWFSMRDFGISGKLFWEMRIKDALDH